MTQETKTTKATSEINFWKIMVASGLGFIVATIALSIISVVFFAIIASSASKETEVSENSVLVIKLDHPIVEQQQDDFNFDLDFMGLQNTGQLGLNKILSAIKSAKDDEKIKGIFLDLYIVNASLADLSEIRAALVDFKTSGKFIIAHSETYTQTSYYLATAADKVYITPTGTMLWKGMSASVMYYKGLLDKLDIDPQIIRHGKFKSAVEPYMQDSMSQANRLQLETFLNSLWDGYVDEIVASRGLDKKALNLYADSLMINSSSKAVSLGLIDKEEFRSDVIDEIKSLVGVDSKDKLKVISLKEYISSKNEVDLSSLKTKQDKIAIIYADGQIVSGKSQKDNMGSETMVQAIKKAAIDSSVKAIVFRINSPGGSALASEVILHEIQKAKAVKPVVVSMGKYAASGGYYIACDANKIFAEPYTLTGSIGVFGMTFNTQKLLNNKLGLKVEVVKTNENADFGNMTRPLTPQEKEFLQFQIEDIYDKFISHVAAGRNLTKEYVDSIGQGRVWAAKDALEIGLVDEIGGISSAIEEAATLANLSDYKVVEYPKVLSFFERIKEDYQSKILEREFGVYYDTYKQIQQLQSMQGVQMRMLMDIDVQ